MQECLERATAWHPGNVQGQAMHRRSRCAACGKHNTPGEGRAWLGQPLHRPRHTQQKLVSLRVLAVSSTPAGYSPLAKLRTAADRVGKKVLAAAEFLGLLATLF